MALRTPKRVLMTADAMGGVWTYTRDLTALLAERGIEVLVAVTGEAPTEELPVPTVHAPLSLEWQDRAGEESCSRTSDWLRRLADEFQPDLIHLNGYVQAAAGWDVPLVAVAHSCVYSWWRAVHGCRPPATWDLYRERVREGLQHAGRVVAPSQSMLDNLQEDYGFPSSRGHVICNATSIEAGSNERVPLIAGSGRSWDEAKNLGLLQRISDQLNWPLEIAGGDRSHRDTVALFARAGIFAHAALYEPFGLGVLEAARCGCALVLADIPSLRELWAGAAVFVNPRYPGHWVQAINALIDDPIRRSALAARARLRSLKFNPKAFIEAYLDLYRSARETREEKFACA